MSDADYSYTVTAVNGTEFSDAVLADANEVWLTLPAFVSPAMIVYRDGRPLFGRDLRGKYWQRRIEWRVARMKRRYDRRVAAEWMLRTQG